MSRKTIFRVLAGFMFITFLIVLPSSSLAEVGQWTMRSPMPTARYGLSTSVVNGKIYAIGGRAGEQLYSIVEVYDPESDTWTRKADMSTSRYLHAASVVNGKIYIMGGAEGNIGPTKLVEEYNPATDTWKRRADLPTKRDRFSASVLNGKIYAISGFQSGSLVPTVDEYDPATDTWRRRASIQTARGTLSTSVVDGKIYAIGGSGTGIVEEYDPGTDTWTTKTDMSTARGGFSTSTVDGKIYAIGGTIWDNTTETRTIFSTVEEYDPKKDTWTTMMDMPTARFHFDSSVVEGRIYAIGGQPGPYPEVTSVVEVYQASPWGFALYPNPADGTLHSGTWVNLSWIPGDFAVSHDVYLGESFDDVYDGLGDTFRGNQVTQFFSAGFPGASYPESLVRGQTYYWRVDEVNDAEPDSPWKGPVWSFTIQPQTAYNPIPADGAESVDLDVELNWSAGADAASHAVYFGDNFDDVNNAAADLNQRGSTYTQTDTTYSPGPLEFAKTYYWRVDELTGGRNAQTHKGNIWSFTTRGAAESPNPSNHAESVRMNAILSWVSADNATSHQIYFGIDKDAVRNANISSPEYKGTQMLDNESYDPGTLSSDTAYYWRVDEVSSDNPDTPLPGNVWSFTTGDFFVIDDFEHYDANDNRIWYTWHDGVGYGVPGTDPYFAGNGTGAVVGDEATSSFTEETIVHGGYQSMPISYDNNKQGYAYYSEVEHTLTDQRDWTKEGVVELSLWFIGVPDNGVESLYVAISNSTGTPAVLVHDDFPAVTIDTWTEWIIPLQDFADQGIILTDVDRIIIGLGTQGNMTVPGGKGKIYIDDIRLYQPRESAE